MKKDEGRRSDADLLLLEKILEKFQEKEDSFYFGLRSPLHQKQQLCLLIIGNAFKFFNWGWTWKMTKNKRDDERRKNNQIEKVTELNESWLDLRAEKLIC